MNITREVKRNRGIVLLLILSLTLSILDIYTSVLLWQRGYIEGNPVMNYMFTYWDPLGFAIINLFLSTLVLSILSWISVCLLEGRSKYLPLLIYCLVRGVVVGNNVLHLL